MAALKLLIWSYLVAMAVGANAKPNFLILFAGMSYPSTRCCHFLVHIRIQSSKSKHAGRTVLLLSLASTMLFLARCIDP